MTQPVSKNSFSRLALATVIVLMIVCSAQAQQEKPKVYKISDAGVQLDLPAGWEASKDPDGTVVIAKKDNGDYVLFSLSVLSSDPAVTLDKLFAAFAEGIFQNAKKDWKNFKPGDVVSDTQGGMPLRAQKIEGSVESMGGDLEGLVIVIGSPKPLAIFGQRPKKHSDVLDRESTAVLSSIRKIE